MTKSIDCVELRTLMVKVFASLAMSEEIRVLMVTNEKFCSELVEKIRLDSFDWLVLIGSLLNDKQGHLVAKLLCKKIQYLIVGTDSKCVEQVKLICWLLSNFAACGEEFVECLAEYSIRLCALMKHESKNVQTEALWAIGNMISTANDV